MIFWTFSILLSMCTSLVLLKKSYLRETSIGWLLAIWATPYIGSIIFLTMVVRRKDRPHMHEEHDNHIPDKHFELSYAQNIIERIGIKSGFLGYDNLEDAVILRDDEFLPEVIKQIDQAKHCINICTFILAGDAKEKLITHLMDAHERGVKICVIADRIGSGLLLNPLKVREFRNLPFETIIFRESFFSSLLYVEKRLHSKMVIIDQQVAFIGSHNIRDEIKPDAKGYCRNLSLLITGSVISQMHIVFAEIYQHATGKKMPIQEKGSKEKHKAIECAARITHSNPLEQHFNYNDYLNSLFFSAKRKMYIWMPYMIPSDILRASIINAHRTGVNVKVLFPIKSDSKLVDNAHQLVLNELTDHGVNCAASTGAFDHSKILIIDDICVVGSTNLDHRSLYRNYEANLEINDRAFSNSLCEIFETEFKNAKHIECTHPSARRNVINQLTSLIATLY